jgi:two-component system cell cycle sensor histidine kinase/response regulator CckA
VIVAQSRDSKLLVRPVASGTRVMLPAALVATAYYTLTAKPMGIALPAPVYIVDAVALAILIAASVVAYRCRVPAGWADVVGAIGWWCPSLAIVVTLYYTHDPLYVLLLINLTASAGVIASTRLVSGTLLAINLIGIPLIIRSGANPPFAISALVSATMFGKLYHSVMRRALMRAERHRLAEADTARQLAGRLAELEASQAERDRLANQLLHAQRMEAVGTLAAGIAHDMNNVLGAITSFADLLRDEATDRRVRGELAQIIAEAERGAALTRGLLAFSRRGQYRKQVIAIEAVIRDVLPLLERTLPKSIAIHDRLDVAGVRVEGDPVHLTQAVVNFGLNAADAMNGTGTLVLAADVQDLAADNPRALPTGAYVRISVTDTGIGMDAATRLRVFEPFFTTKPLGRGTGLGLSTVWGIAQAHNGAVDVETAPGRGATFSLYLPTTDAPLAVTVKRAASQPVARSGTMLVVDDEPAVRNGTRRILSKLGFDVVVAGDGDEALQIFDQHDGAFDLVVLDMGMPVMGGPECFAALRRKSQVPILVATGYAVDAEAQALVAAGAGIIEKPFRSEDLVREVTQMLRK